jgi:hypothetical protein
MPIYNDPSNDSNDRKVLNVLSCTRHVPDGFVTKVIGDRDCVGPVFITKVVVTDSRGKSWLMEYCYPKPV